MVPSITAAIASEANVVLEAASAIEPALEATTVDVAVPIAGVEAKRSKRGKAPEVEPESDAELATADDAIGQLLKKRGRKGPGAK